MRSLKKGVTILIHVLTLWKISPQCNYVYVPVKTDTHFLSSRSKFVTRIIVIKIENITRKIYLHNMKDEISSSLFSMHLLFSASLV